MMVAPGKGGIAGGVGASMNGAASVAVYVAVDDLKKSLAKVAQAGGTLAMPPTELPGNMGSIAGFTDPAGNWVGLWAAAKKVPAKQAAVLRKSGKGTRKPPKKTTKRTAKRR